MRTRFFGQHSYKALIAVLMAAIMLCFALPFDAFAAEEIGETAEENGEPANERGEPADREVWFTYECTDCLGEAVYLDKDEIAVYEPSYYLAEMMFCDTDHVLRVEGDGVTADNVTLTSLTPGVLQTDSSGNVTLLKTGRAEIQATVAADDVYKECTITLGVTVNRHDGWDGETSVRYADRSAFMGLDLTTSDGSHQLVVPLRPGANVTYTSLDPGVVFVDQNGLVTPIAEGHTDIRFDVDDGGGRYNPGYFYETITVTGEEILIDQQITGEKGPFTIDWHDGLQLDLQAKTALTYSVYNGTDIASVDQSGFVRFTAKGGAAIRVTAAADDTYKPAELIINITARDYAEEEAERIAAEEAARIAAEEAARQAAALTAAAESARIAQLQLAQAQSLSKPTLKVKAKKGKKIKLTWSKVANADGYVVYVKYPGSKKYVRAVSRNATVKSVTHKGLSRRRVYRYKVAAYKIVNGRVYYSPFSKVRKAKVK